MGDPTPNDYNEERDGLRGDGLLPPHHPRGPHTVKFDMDARHRPPTHAASFSLGRNINSDLNELQQHDQHPYSKPDIKPILKNNNRAFEKKALLSRSTPAYVNHALARDVPTSTNNLDPLRTDDSVRYGNNLPDQSSGSRGGGYRAGGQSVPHRMQQPYLYSGSNNNQSNVASIMERTQPHYGRDNNNMGPPMSQYKPLGNNNNGEAHPGNNSPSGQQRPWGPPQRSNDDLHNHSRMPGSYLSQYDLFNNSTTEKPVHDDVKESLEEDRHQTHRSGFHRPPIGDRRQSSIGQLRMHGMLNNNEQHGNSQSTLKRGLSVVEAALLAPITRLQAEMINEESMKPDFDESRLSRQLEDEGIIPHPDLIPKYPLEELVPFLTKMACAFHSYGATANRTEWHMAEISRTMGVIASYSVVPTMIIITFGIPQGMDAISRTIRIDQNITASGKLFLVDQLITKIILRQITLYEANDELQRIVDKEPNYSKAIVLLAHALCSGSSAIVCFNSGWLEVILATLLGLLSGGIRRLAEMSATFNRIFDVVLALIVSVIVIPITIYSEGICFSALVLSALIWSLPGLPLTLAIRELATGNLMAGTIRMFASFLTALKLGFGIAIGTGIPAWTNTSRISQSCAVVASNWARIPTFFVVTSCFNILLDTHIRQWPGQTASAAVGYLISFVAGTIYGVQTEVVVIIAAFGVTLTGNIYSRITHNPGVNYIFVGILLLVPGSVGVLSAVALFDKNAWSGLNFGFTMVLIGFCITIGTLMADLIVFPRYSLNHHLF